MLKIKSLTFNTDTESNIIYYYIILSNAIYYIKYNIGIGY